MTDPDAPESAPTVQPVWVAPYGPPGDENASFNFVSGWRGMRVRVPFPYRLVAHPAVGAAYVPLWTDDLPMGAAAVYQAAYDGWGGFRFVDLPDH